MNPDLARRAERHTIRDDSHRRPFVRVVAPGWEYTQALQERDTQ